MSDDHRGKIIPIPKRKSVAYVEGSTSDGNPSIKWRLLTDCKWHVVVDARRFYHHESILPQLNVISPVNLWSEEHRQNFHERFAQDTVESPEIRLQPTDAFKERAEAHGNPHWGGFVAQSPVIRTFFEGRHRTRYVVEYMRAREMVIGIPSTRNIYDDRRPLGSWSDTLTSQHDQLVQDEIPKYDFFLRFGEPRYL